MTGRHALLIFAIAIVFAAVFVTSSLVNAAARVVELRNIAAERAL